MAAGPYLVTGTSYDKVTEVKARVSVGETARLTLKPFAKLNVTFISKDEDALPKDGVYRYIYQPDSGNDITTKWKWFEDNTPVMIENLLPGTYVIEAHTLSPGYSAKNVSKVDWSKKGHLLRSQDIRLDWGDIRDITMYLESFPAFHGKR